MKQISALFFVLFVIVAGRAAADPRPADFDYEDEDRRLDNRIEFPEVKGDVSVMISCFSQIERNGKMDTTGCIARDNFHAPFAAAIMDAAKKARVRPAVIDGKERKIYLQFRVEFVAKDDARDITLYLNPGNSENVDAYGPDHIAAQRVIGKEPWQDVCPQRAQFLVLARAFVGEDGRAQSPSLERMGGIMPAPDCQEAIKQTILESAYTPAMADGYPVPSAFVEMFSN